jgi:hypothetical protein
MYTSDKPKNDLHRMGCRRYRDINRAYPTATAEAPAEFLHPTSSRSSAMSSAPAAATTLAEN